MKKQLDYSIDDIMNTFVWMPYKDFAKSIVNDDNRDIILKNYNNVSYEEIRNAGLKMERKLFDSAVKLLKLIASDIDKAFKMVRIMELYKQNIQLHPHYSNKELKEYLVGGNTEIVRR